MQTLNQENFFQLYYRKITFFSSFNKGGISFNSTLTLLMLISSKHNIIIIMINLWILSRPILYLLKEKCFKLHWPTYSYFSGCNYKLLFISIILNQSYLQIWLGAIGPTGHSLASPVRTEEWFAGKSEPCKQDDRLRCSS